jgi:anti-sigma-K factor RskA
MDVEEKVALYALGALEPAEAAELDKLAAASPELAARLAEARVMFQALALDPEPIAPSPALKQRLTTRIDAELSPLQERLNAQRTRPPVDAPRRRGGLGQLLRGLTYGLAAVATVAATTLGVSLTRTQNQLASAQRDAARLQTELTAARDQINTKDAEISALRATTDRLTLDLAAARADVEALSRTLAVTQGEATDKASALAEARSNVDLLQSQLSVISVPNVRTAALPASKDEFGKGAITVFFAPDGKQALLSASNLPPLPKDRVYQLWLIRDNKPLPSVVLNTDANGTGRSLVPADLEFANYQLLGVTVEKTGGSPTPNPEGPVYLGPLPIKG